MITRALGSIKNRILLGGLATIILIGLLWLLCSRFFLDRYQNHLEVANMVEDVHDDMLRMRNAQKEFMLTELRSPIFYQTGRSPSLDIHNSQYDKLRRDVNQLLVKTEGNDSNLKEQIGQGLDKYEDAYKALTAAIRQRGFYNFGLEGKLRKAINAVERDILRTGNPQLRIELLEVRRAEKEYMLRNSQDRIDEWEAHLARLRTISASTPFAATILSELRNYENAFEEFRKIDQKIGLTPNEGLRGEMTAAIDNIESISGETEARSEKEGYQASQNLRFANFVILVAGAVLGFFIFSIFAKSLSDPIIALKNAAVQIGSGQLDARVDVRSNDEIGVLGKTFNEMAANLQRISQELHGAAQTLASSAGEILASTSQVAASASETAAAVSQTTATVEQVKQTAQLSNQKARDVADSAQHSAEVSFAGNHSVGEAIGGMERVREQMNSIAESVINLSEQSQAIGDIINTVNDLAEQSNLLAVNAAIEAAKAGEQGKGFAVVAQEVKSLAEQSKQATGQVRTILNEIQKATSAAVMSTEQGTKAVEAGLSQAEEAGHSIEGLAHSIEQAAQAALQISASSQEQLIGVDQVALAMNSIKDASTQNVSSMRQLEIAARDLSDVGQNLQQLVEQFRVTHTI